jgi:sec-independent protein translocase protein TatA
VFGRLGFWEILIIVVIALVVFGPKKLPDLGKALGRGIKEFKDATSKMADEINSAGSPTVSSGQQPVAVVATQTATEPAGPAKADAAQVGAVKADLASPGAGATITDA